MPRRRTERATVNTGAGATISTDSAKRSARTGVQSGIGIGLVVQGWNLFSPHKLSVEQTLWLTAAGAGVPAMVAFLMNMLEEAGMPALFKGKSDDTTQRMLADLAEEFARLREVLERRYLPAEPEDPARIFTRQDTPAPGRRVGLVDG